MVSSLYVHIPFCEHLCPYCDFPKLIAPSHLWIEPYLKALKKEIDGFSLKLPLKTLYIGGGTPTYLKTHELEDLLSFLSAFCDSQTEFSIEANPESLSEEKLEILRRHGVNRLSLGLQSTHEARLLFLGRHHRFENVVQKVSMAKKKGFKRLNLDLIIAYPDETKEELIDDLNNLLSLDVDHLSLYSLTVCGNSVFSIKKIPEASQELGAELYSTALQILRAHGYERYEVSNFARHDEKCLHNLTYWHDLPYAGAGLGAAGYLDDHYRYRNSTSLPCYLEGRGREIEDASALKDQIEYFLLTNLRLEEGFSLNDFSMRFQLSFPSLFSKTIMKFEDNGCLSMQKEMLKLTDRGIMILDRILVEFFEELDGYCAL